MRWFRGFWLFESKEEGRRKKEEGRGKKEEGRGKKEEGRRPFGFAQDEKKEEGRRNWCQFYMKLDWFQGSAWESISARLCLDCERGKRRQSLQIFVTRQSLVTSNNTSPVAPNLI